MKPTANNDNIIFKSDVLKASAQINEKEGTITAKVSAFNNVDRVKDVVLPTAFDNYIKTFKSENLTLHQDTDHDETIGFVTELEAKPDGLYAKFVIATKSEAGQRAYELYKLANELNKSLTHSFAAKIINSYEKDGIRYLSDLELTRVTTVIDTIPVNSQTQQISVKSMEMKNENNNKEVMQEDNYVCPWCGADISFEGENSFEDDVKEIAADIIENIAYRETWNYVIGKYGNEIKDKVHQIIDTAANGDITAVEKSITDLVQSTICKSCGSKISKKRAMKKPVYKSIERLCNLFSETEIVEKSEPEQKEVEIKEPEQKENSLLEKFYTLI